MNFPQRTRLLSIMTSLLVSISGSYVCAIIFVHDWLKPSVRTLNFFSVLQISAPDDVLLNIFSSNSSVRMLRDSNQFMRSLFKFTWVLMFLYIMICLNLRRKRYYNNSVWCSARRWNFRLNPTCSEEDSPQT